MNFRSADVVVDDVTTFVVFAFLAVVFVALPPAAGISLSLVSFESVERWQTSSASTPLEIDSCAASA